MFCTDKIILNGDLGEKYFIFPNGERSKTFYNANKFMYIYGQYPILNEKGEVVEYMDLMGNFSEGHTELAHALYAYAISINQIPFRAFGLSGEAYTGVYHFPSKFLKDEKVREFIKNEEDYRYCRLCECNRFRSIIERMRYKHYIDTIWKQKMKKVQRLLKEDAEREQNLEI